MSPAGARRVAPAAEAVETGARSVGPGDAPAAGAQADAQQASRAMHRASRALPRPRRPSRAPPTRRGRRRGVPRASSLRSPRGMNLFTSNRGRVMCPQTSGRSDRCVPAPPSSRTSRRSDGPLDDVPLSSMPDARAPLTRAELIRISLYWLALAGLWAGIGLQLMPVLAHAPHLPARRRRSHLRPAPGSAADAGARSVRPCGPRSPSVWWASSAPSWPSWSSRSRLP